MRSWPPSLCEIASPRPDSPLMVDAWCCRNLSAVKEERYLASSSERPGGIPVRCANGSPEQSACETLRARQCPLRVDSVEKVVVAYAVLYAALAQAVRDWWYIQLIMLGRSVFFRSAPHLPLSASTKLPSFSSSAHSQPSGTHRERL
jgi:hypothetical protein